MLDLASDDLAARRQMCGLVWYLTSFGLIDGDFNVSEKAFVERTLRRVIERWVARRLPDASAAERYAMVNQETARFTAVSQDTERAILEMWAEPIELGRDPQEFVENRLKVRCFEVFQSFDGNGRRELLALVDELQAADGFVHPAEAKFRTELQRLQYDRDPAAQTLIMEQLEIPQVEAVRRSTRPSDGPAPAALLAVERPFVDPGAASGDLVRSELDRIVRVRRAIADRRAPGQGRLDGLDSVAELPAGADFLDGFVHVLRPAPGQDYELTVVGDLHGCWSCLKAVLVQSRFFEKVAAFKANPTSTPDPRLVFLGDYLDRGRFGLEVLRGVLEVFLAAPQHVYVLRGNHEWFVEMGGEIIPAVHPAEDFHRLAAHVPEHVLRAYMALFEDLPHAFLFGKIMMVHGGPPTDGALKKYYRSLSDLNHPAVRMMSMWGDPSSADVIPAQLQDTDIFRFSYGRLQTQAFLHRLGLNSIIRGHEVIREGFLPIYEGTGVHLYTLFSAGGSDNDDLPTNSHYRDSEPTALTVTHSDGADRLEPWPLDYRRFMDPATNALYRPQP